jgi:hypothetical protein
VGTITNTTNNVARPRILLFRVNLMWTLLLEFLAGSVSDDRDLWRSSNGDAASRAGGDVVAEPPVLDGRKRNSAGQASKKRQTCPMS